MYKICLNRKKEWVCSKKQPTLLRDIEQDELTWRKGEFIFVATRENFLSEGGLRRVYKAASEYQTPGELTPVAINSVQIQVGEHKQLLRELTIRYRANHDNIMKMYNAAYDPKSDVLEFATEMSEFNLVKVVNDVGNH